MDSYFQIRNESSSKEVSNDEDGDEEGNDSAVEKPPKNSIQPTATPMLSHADIDLDTIIRGPTTYRRSVAEVLSDAENDEDASQADVVLEEDDDSTFRRLSKKLERASPPTDHDDEVNTENSEDLVASPSSPSSELADSSTKKHSQIIRDDVPDHTFPEMDTSTEFVEVGQSAAIEALTNDTNFIQPDNSDCGNIEASLAESTSRNDTPLLRSPRSTAVHRAEVNIKPSHKPVFVQSNSSIPPSASTLGVIEGILAEGDECFSPSMVETSQNNTLSDLPHGSPDDHDPIESADDFFDLTPKNQPRASSRLASRNVGNVKPSGSPVKNGMKGRKGKNLAVVMEPTQFATEQEELSLPSPALEGSDHAMVRLDKSKEPGLASKANPANGARSISPLDTAKVRDRLLKSKRGKDEEIAKNPVINAEAEKPESTRSKRGSKGVGTKPKRTQLNTPEASSASSASPAPPSSPVRYTALPPSSPYIEEGSSQRIDQLSSPGGRVTGPKASPKTRRSRAKRLPSRNSSDVAGVVATDPLSILPQSQLPFPSSQRNAETPERSHVGNLDATTFTSESEDEVERLATRTPSSTATFRGLIDITSKRTPFAGSLRSSVSLPSQSQVNGKDFSDIYAVIDGEEDGDGEDDSGSNSEKEKSHIPLARRAGARVLRSSKKDR